MSVKIRKSDYVVAPLAALAKWLWRVYFIEFYSTRKGAVSAGVFSVLALLSSLKVTATGVAYTGEFNDILVTCAIAVAAASAIGLSIRATRHLAFLAKREAYVRASFRTAREERRAAETEAYKGRA